MGLEVQNFCKRVHIVYVLSAMFCDQHNYVNFELVMASQNKKAKTYTVHVYSTCTCVTSIFLPITKS